MLDDARADVTLSTRTRSRDSGVQGPDVGRKETMMVLNEVQPKLAGLKPLARELNEASDAFTQELKAIEDELGALGLGVEAESGPIATSVVMDDDTPDPTSAVRVGRVTYLAY